jgi:hypothetical protein
LKISTLNPESQPHYESVSSFTRQARKADF